MTTSRTSSYKPALAWFAALGAAWVFGVVTLGAFTTSIHAGMAFPDWPLSNGSINPEGWLTEIDKFAEHSHRLFGMVMGLFAIGLVVWLQLREDRSWLRKLGWTALAIVIVQGILGGKRVLLDSIAVPGFEMSLGQMLRIPHGILAQVYVCVLFAIAAGLSRGWIEATTAPAATRPDIGCKIRFLSSVATLLVFVQLIVAAVMRHNNAGLAIPTFPLTPDGGLIPSMWDFRVAIHFAHRGMAVVLTVVLCWLAILLWKSPAAGRGFKYAAGLIVALLTGQIVLGAVTVLTYRNPYYTTAHVIGGALILATVFTVTWWAHRNVIERTASTPLAA
ncbi:COX15/CtaA family protein [Rariglobus hedericola]|nr:COX15/CtaA family protein [Rariglobus hedericola]